ncbi:MAG: thioredoxin family protein [Anaerolineales bacterium]
MVTVKVLGTGCANCKKLEGLVRKAISEMGFEAEVIKVTDYNEIMQYPILSTPGLVINGKLVSSGRIPSQAEITTWLADAAMEQEQAA